MCVSSAQGGDGIAFYQVKANMAILEKDFKRAEMHYMEQVPDKLEYIKLHLNRIASRVSRVVFCVSPERHR